MIKRNYLLSTESLVFKNSSKKLISDVKKTYTEITLLKGAFELGLSFSKRISQILKSGITNLYNFLTKELSFTEKQIKELLLEILKLLKEKELVKPLTKIDEKEL